MLTLSDPLQRTALGAFVGLGAAALLTESSDPPLSDYLSKSGTYMGLTGAFAIGAYFLGRTPVERSDLSGIEAFKAPTAGGVIALTGKNLDYVDVVCATADDQRQQHQPMRAITMVAGFVGAAAALGALHSRSDFRVEGVTLAGLGAAIGIYNAYNLVQTHEQMQRKFVAQLQIAEA